MGDAVCVSAGTGAEVGAPAGTGDAEGPPGGGYTVNDVVVYGAM